MMVIQPEIKARSKTNTVTRTNQPTTSTPTVDQNMDLSRIKNTFPYFFHSTYIFQCDLIFFRYFLFSVRALFVTQLSISAVKVSTHSSHPFRVVPYFVNKNTSAKDVKIEEIDNFEVKMEEWNLKPQRASLCGNIFMLEFSCCVFSLALRSIYVELPGYIFCRYVISYIIIIQFSSDKNKNHFLLFTWLTPKKFAHRP